MIASHEKGHPTLETLGDPCADCFALKPESITCKRIVTIGVAIATKRDAVTVGYNGAISPKTITIKRREAISRVHYRGPEYRVATVTVAETVSAVCVAVAGGD